MKAKIKMYIGEAKNEFLPRIIKHDIPPTWFCFVFNRGLKVYIDDAKSMNKTTLVATTEKNVDILAPQIWENTTTAGVTHA